MGSRAQVRCQDFTLASSVKVTRSLGVDLEIFGNCMKLVSMLHASALESAGLTLAFFFPRTLGEYPHCPSDEHSWALVAAQVAQGVS